MENNVKSLLIGSNNSISYLQPSNKKIFKHRYQRKTISEQYFQYGVRAFDLKIFFNDNGRGYYKIGNLKYENYSIFEHLSFFNRQKDCVVKITLDERVRDSKRPNIDFIEERFKYICRVFEISYENVCFIGGTRYFDNKVLYEFKRHGYSDYRISELYSNNESVFNKKLREFSPILHAKLNNRKYQKLIDSCKNYPLIMYKDFVDIH